MPRFTTANFVGQGVRSKFPRSILQLPAWALAASAHFAFRAAEQRPDKIKGMVCVEPAASGGADIAKPVKDMPLLLLYSDFIDQDSRWVAYRKNAMTYVDAIRAAGGKVDIDSPTEQGIKGNSHMLMMGKNSGEVLEVISKSLVAKGPAEN